MASDTLFLKSLDHLKTELASVRAGRATPELVENITVQAYGNTMSLQQVASIVTQDSRTLLIQPWDVGTIKDIEKGIQQSSLGIQPVVDGKSIRIVMPQLTEERRKEYVKVIEKKGEEARVAMRKIREEVMKELKQKKADGDISEDDAGRASEEVQKALDKAITQVADALAAKIKELTTV